MKYKNESGWSMVGMMAGVVIIGALSFGAGMAQADTMQGNEGVGLVKKALGVLKEFKRDEGAVESPFLIALAEACRKEGGTLSDIWPEVCCKDGRHVHLGPDGKGGFEADWREETYRFDERCGCPDGRDPIVFGGGLICCQDGKMMSSDGKYKYYNGICGCPGGGKQSDEEPQACCKGNLTMDPRTGEYSMISSECGCPDNGEIRVHYEYFDEKRWEHISVETCCKNGGNLNKKTGDYKEALPTVCGCPDDADKRSRPNDGICCKNGRIQGLHRGEYVGLRPDLCDCPDGGHYIDSLNICCKNNLAMDPQGKYTILSPKACNCPGGIKPNGKGACCQNGKAWNSNTKKYDTNDPACCPEPKPAGPYACENGKWVCIGSEAGGKCTGYGDADGHFES